MPNTIPRSIALQVTQAAGIIKRHLGKSIIAIHLFGSAVDGKLQPHSDVDLLVTVDDPPSEAARHVLMEDLLMVSAQPGSSTSLRALEVTVVMLEHIVPWRYPPRRELQFGEWLRADILAGVVEKPVIDHDLAILLTKIRSSSVAIVGPGAKDLFDAVPQTDLMRALLDTVAQWDKPADWADEERNIILALARGWYTASSGKITSKDAAAAWLLQKIASPYRAVLRKARASYLGQEQDDLATQPAEVAAFIAHARRAIERLCSAAR